MQIKIEEFKLSKAPFGASTGTKHWEGKGEGVSVSSPVDGALIGKLKMASESDYTKVIQAAKEAALYWRAVPAPKRGEIVRQFGDVLRKHKELSLIHI